MRSAVFALSTVVGFFAFGQSSRAEQEAPATPESLTAKIETLRPKQLVWREIGWNRCLLDGLKQSREQKKPVLLWAFINADPQGERC